MDRATIIEELVGLFRLRDEGQDVDASIKSMERRLWETVETEIEFDDNGGDCEQTSTSFGVLERRLCLQKVWDSRFKEESVDDPPHHAKV